MKYKIIYLVIAFLYCSAAHAADCFIAPADESKLLAMPFEQFDQSKEGWRQLDATCYLQTGILIDRYTLQNAATLTDWQKRILVWHAGQMYAMNKDYLTAKQRFLQAVDPNETNNAPMNWNDYVYATIAFLDHDLETLAFHRERLAQGPTLNKVNLDVVDRLIQHFDEPYTSAYGK